MVKRIPESKHVVAIVGILLWGVLAYTAQAADRPAVLDFTLDSLQEVPILRTQPLDRPALLAEDAAKSQFDGPERFAVGEDVAVRCEEAGRWEDPTTQHRVWRLRIQAPGALSVNLGFSVFDLPAGGRLSLYPTDLSGADDPRGVRTFHPDDADVLAQLWTPVVLGDDIIVEVEVPTGSSSPRVELARVNRGYRWFGEPAQDKAGSCNIDMVCPEGDDWREDGRSVGVYTIDGTWKCTGVLVNNTSRDGAPLFLTAHHCNNSMELFAHSVVVYWNFESPVCGQHGGGSLDQFTAGALFRASSPESDFTLIEMDEPLDPAFQLTLAGWDRRDRVPPAAVAIHHPSTDEKSISFENDPLSVTSYLQVGVPGNGTHLRVRDWDLGTTEPGSSGSPLFDPDHRVVGQLHGGYAACGNDTSDWYGRLFVSWNGGGAADTRLRDWLDPEGTGEDYVELLDPALPELLVTPAGGLEFNLVAGADPGGISGSYVLHNVGGVDLPFQASANEGWVSLDPAFGTIAPLDSATVTISGTAALSGLTAGLYQAELSFVNSVGGLGDATRSLSLQVLSVTPGVATPVPNPFRTFTVATYVLPAAGPVRARIMDLQGRCVRDFGTLDGDLGANELAWDGTDNAGRPVAAGVYALRLEAGELTLGTTMTRTR